MQTTQNLESFSNNTPDHWSWLCGLADGEGCFTISVSGGIFHCLFAISLRMDDWPTLLFAKESTGLGILTSKKSRESSMMTWTVATIDECLLLAEGLLLGGGLRSKKQRDFHTWYEALRLLDTHGGGKWGTAHERLPSLKRELEEGRLFQPIDPAEYANHLGRKGGRIGRSSKEFWKTDGATRHRQWRQLRYAKLTQEQIDDIVQRIEGGESRSSLAKEYGVSVSTVSKFYSGTYLRRDGTLTPILGKPGPPATSKEFWRTEVGQLRKKQTSSARRVLSSEQVEQLVSDRLSGMSQRQLGQKYGVSRPTVAKYLSHADATLD